MKEMLFLWTLFVVGWGFYGLAFVLVGFGLVTATWGAAQTGLLMLCLAELFQIRTKDR
jgi:hypothetical protein